MERLQGFIDIGGCLLGSRSSYFVCVKHGFEIQKLFSAPEQQQDTYYQQGGENSDKITSPPTAIPIEATTNNVEAVVMPVTRSPRACRIEPAPIKPMPGMICAAMRV